MESERYLEPYIKKDLKEKMVFIGGPRQVGKTTLAKHLGESTYPQMQYLNWDNQDHRQNILKGRFKSDASLVIFDEIHKYKGWKNLIKGYFDTHKDHLNILVTGSARLDLYRRGGDSLMGRYHYFRLHPFSVSETLGKPPELDAFSALNFGDGSALDETIFKDLLRFGGFPEPFIKKEDRIVRRFHRERLERLVKEDIRDIEAIRDLSSLEILAQLLPEKVGSLFSLNSLREDLQVTHKTLSHWVEVLERFYYHYRITPFASSQIKSLRKEPKLYLWDWSQIEDEGARLENLIASHLLKTVHFLQDWEGLDTNLHFIRDNEGREVDFLVTINKKPWFAVEVKNGSQEISKPLLYFKEKLQLPLTYQVLTTPGLDFMQKGVRVMSASKFLTGLK